MKCVNDDERMGKILMLYISTRGQTEMVCSAHAISRGLADDGGLFVPQKFEKVSLNDILAMGELSYGERAAKILSLFLTDYTEEELLDSTNAAYGGDNDEQHVQDQRRGDESQGGSVNAVFFLLDHGILLS